MITAKSGETYIAGGAVDAGTYKCRGCGLRIGIDHLDEAPRCPACGGTSLRPAPLCEAARALGPMPTIEEPLLPGPSERPEWLAATRDELAGNGSHLVFEDDYGIHTVPLAVGWSRIGRSATSDIRLDDPTVSRRHA